MNGSGVAVNIGIYMIEKYSQLVRNNILVHSLVGLNICLKSKKKSRLMKWSSTVYLHAAKGLHQQMISKFPINSKPYQNISSTYHVAELNSNHQLGSKSGKFLDKSFQQNLLF